MNLYPHNQEAYQNVMQAFQTNQRACVVHATGTGKSYIIAAVAGHFKSVLIVAPNNFVLDETRKVCHKRCEFRTYASVMYYEGDAGRYDLIVLDEFHRGGAEKWGIGVQRLIDANPQAKLFGTSATNIRYLDGMRNMADELFDGHVVSYLPLRKAIDLGILPDPTYVSSIYTMDEEVNRRKKRILNSQLNIDKDGKCRKLVGIAHRWNEAGGVPRIIRKYFTHDMQRIIVFCSKVSRAAKARELLSEWFGLAGFKRVRYYNIDYQEKRLEREMADFQKPLGDYDLKVAISVNMLNEGVHIPHVDGVIMLRSTISRIIIEQQVGRCLTADNSGVKPVVLDLVNNMDSIKCDGTTYCFTDGAETKSDDYDKDKSDEGFPFKVIDECRDIRILLKQLDNEINNLWTKERILEEAAKYTTIKEWSKASPSSYQSAHKMGILPEATAHMTRLWERKWNIEAIAADALKYSKISEWERESPGAYDAACKMHIIDEVTSHMNKMQMHIWTKEEVLAEAMKYTTKAEWRLKSPKSYGSARNHNWVEEAAAHMTPLRKHWTKELCREEAAKYNTRTEWKKKSIMSYRIALKNGWVDVFEHIKKRYNTHTKEECMESASHYNTKRDWINACDSLYSYARIHGWLDDCCAHMKALYNIKRTKKDCMESARTCKTRYAWVRKDKKSYEFALNHGWLDECCAHMEEGCRKFWTKEKCMEIAKQYNTRTEWAKNDRKSYDPARMYGWLDECCAHMKSGKKIIRTKEECIEDARRFSKRSEWSKNSATTYNYASLHGWLDECCAHMATVKPGPKHSSAPTPND